MLASRDGADSEFDTFFARVTLTQKRDHVYHPDFHGSFTIKAVLTPLVPDLTYSDLVIVDGLLASVEIARLLFVAGKIPAEEVPRVRRDLLDYCERDTWAMVRLLDKLRTLA